MWTKILEASLLCGLATFVACPICGVQGILKNIKKEDSKTEILHVRMLSKLAIGPTVRGIRSCNSVNFGIDLILVSSHDMLMHLELVLPHFNVRISNFAKWNSRLRHHERLYKVVLTLLTL